jgi:hypothetical protein
MRIRLSNLHVQSKDPCTPFRLSVASGSSTVLWVRRGNETGKLHELTGAATPPLAVQSTEPYEEPDESASDVAQGGPSTN